MDRPGEAGLAAREPVSDIDDQILAMWRALRSNPSLDPRWAMQGNGSRFGSQSSWDEFTQWQWVTARPQVHGFPF